MGSEMICLCREVNKETGEIVAYKIEAEVTGHLLFCLAVRQRANPELRYYAALRKEFEANAETVLKNLRRRNISSALLSTLNVVPVA